MVLQRHDHRGQTELRFTLADVAYLSSDVGAAALAEVSGFALSDASLLADVAAIRDRFADRAAVLVETTRLRRRAADKLAGIAEELPGWLFTDAALQQATSAAVARYRARRLGRVSVHDATCSIGTELAALLPVARDLLGSDVDEVRLAMARHNLAGRVPLCRADALRPVSRDAVVLLDPSRRAGGRRRFDPRTYLPPLDQLIDTYRERAIVIKCAPGIDFDAVRRLGFPGEIEVTSVAGSVREACLWSGALAQPGVQRRATLLTDGLTDGETLTDLDPADCAAGAPGRWIIDPDGAVVRAGLVRHYATRHGLWQLDPDIAYLTGDALPAGIRGLEVIEEIPLRESVLRQRLSQYDCGSLEILVRGVDVDPDVLRRRLRPTGSRSLALVITRIGRGAKARASVFVCR